MIRIFLRFGLTRKRFLPTLITKIYGEFSEEMVETGGSGMFRMKPTTGASTLTSTRTSNPSLITMDPTSGNLYMRKIALKALGS